MKSHITSYERFIRPRRNLVHAVLALGLLLLAGCGSSPEDRVYEAFTCSKVATLLEKDRKGDIAFAKVIPDLKQLEASGGNPARLAIEMNQRFQDDVPLHRFSVSGQMAVLTEIYLSDDCQALYMP